MPKGVYDRNKPAKPGKARQKPASKKPVLKGKKGTQASHGEGVTLQQLADRLNRDPKSVRGSIRRIKGGSQVGRGGRYGCKSWNDPELKGLMKELSSK